MAKTNARVGAPAGTLVRCIANTYEDATVLEDLGLLDIPDLDLDSEDA